MPDTVDVDTRRLEVDAIDSRPVVLEITAPTSDVIEIDRSATAAVEINQTDAPPVLEVVVAGPQGPGPDPAAVAADVAALVAGFLQAKPAQVYLFEQPVSTWPMPHSFGRMPAVTLYSLDGRRIHTDVYATADTATAHFPTPVPGIAVLT